MHKEFSNLPGTQQYYKAVKSLKLSNTRTVRKWSIKSADNIPIVEHSKIIKCWKEFYSILYHSDKQHSTT